MSHDDQNELHVAKQELLSGNPAVIEQGAKRLIRLWPQGIPLINELLDQDHATADVHNSLLTNLNLFGDDLIPIARSLQRFFIQPQFANETRGQRAQFLFGRLGAAGLPFVIERLPRASADEWKVWITILLTEIPSKPAVQALCALLKEHDGDAHLRALSTLRVVDLGREIALPHVLEFLTTIDPFNDVARQAVVELLTEVSTDCFDEILAYLDSPNPYVRAAICEVIGAIVSWNGLDFLSDSDWSVLAGCRKDSHAVVRVAANLMFSEIGMRACTSVVDTRSDLTILKITDSTDRNLALRMIARSYGGSSRGYARSLKHLLGLPDKSYMGIIERRKIAAAILTGPEEGVNVEILDVLRSALVDINDPYRAEYLHAIRCAGKKVGDLAETVVQLLNDPALSDDSIEALVAMDTVNASIIDSLQMLLCASVDRRRMAALTVIERMHVVHTDLIDTIVLIADESDEPVSRLALRVLRSLRNQPEPRPSAPELGPEVTGETNRNWYGETDNSTGRPDNF